MTWGRKTGGRDFKPGQSGNPAGLPALPEDVRAARALTAKEFIQAATEILNMTPREIEALAMNPYTPAYKLVLASTIMQCVKHGDMGRFELILDRLIGPAPRKAVAPPEEKKIDLSALSIDELETLQTLVAKTGEPLEAES